ncbi:MAG: TRAP transporter substrate-binding protein [Rhizobiaceae bacterium]
MKKRTFLAGVITAGFALAAPGLSAVGAQAQEVSLKLHQFLPAGANVPKHVLEPWMKSVMDASGGKMQIEMFSAMALGGKPPELIDQVKDGVVDIAWTVVGYSPGRFPRTEVFELPFMMSNAEATSKAYWDLFESDMKDQDFKDFKILGAWVHGPGVIHAKGDGVQKLEDMKGKKLRGPSRMTNALLKEMGAEPIGLPVPGIPEALSKGVIDGTVIPWEVTGALKVAELTNTHAEFTGDKALYTVTFVLAMNKQKYDSLSDEQKKWLDDNSGAAFSAFAGKTMQDYDAPSRQIAVDRGNKIVEISGDELARWKTAAKPVVDGWLGEMKEKGIDGQDLLDRANALITKYTAN